MNYTKKIFLLVLFWLCYSVQILWIFSNFICALLFYNIFKEKIIPKCRRVYFFRIFLLNISLPHVPKAGLPSIEIQFDWRDRICIQTENGNMVYIIRCAPLEKLNVYVSLSQVYVACMLTVLRLKLTSKF